MFLKSIALALTFMFSFESFAMTIKELMPLYDIPSYSETSELEQNILASVGQDFISDPKNKEILATKAGKNLLNKHAKLLNLIEIQRVFRECEKEKSSRRNLYLRIITSAQNTEHIKVDCKQDLTRFKSLQDFSSEIQKLSQTIELSSLQKGLHDNSFQNLIKSYVFMKRKFSDDVKASEIVNSLCHSRSVKKRCSEEEKKDYLNFTKQELEKYKNTKALSSLEAKNILNKKIKNINNEIVKIKPKTDAGWFNNFAFDTSDPVYDEKSNKAYDNYQETYLEEATSGIGTLLMTSSIKDKVSALKAKEQDEYENSDRHRNKTTYWFEKHKNVDEEDIEKGVNDALSQMEDQAEKLNSLERGREAKTSYQLYGNHAPADSLLSEKYKRKRDIKRLIKTNPAAVGQLLASHPEYAQTICNLIIDIEKNDESDEFWDDAFFWGGIVVGGALMVTGLGVVGGLLIARSVATTALLKTVGSAVTITGAAVGTIESSYYTKELVQARLSMAMAEQSFISGSGDKESIVESKQALKEFNEAKFTLALTLGFTAIDLAGMYGIMKGARYKEASLDTLNKQKVKSLNKMTETIEKILGSQALINKFKNLIKIHGGEKVSELISIIGHLNPKLRIKVLNHIEFSKGEKLDKTISALLKSVRECSK